MELIQSFNSRRSIGAPVDSKEISVCTSIRFIIDPN